MIVEEEREWERVEGVGKDNWEKVWLGDYTVCTPPNLGLRPYSVEYMCEL